MMPEWEKKKRRERYRKRPKKKRKTKRERGILFKETFFFPHDFEGEDEGKKEEESK